MEGLLFFIMVLVVLFAGYSVAFTFAGMSLLIGSILLGPDLFALMPYRIMSIMENTILMAIPMFIFMGIVIERSGLGERLLESVGKVFSSMPGGLAIGTVVVGTLLAASTGVVGASVVAMGVISLPVMLKHKYHPALASGTICAAGTLGQIVPPSIVLILLGDVMGIAVGDLFRAAILPSILLVFGYIVYIVVVAKLRPDYCPPIATDQSKIVLLKQALRDVVPTLVLIVLVLSSIFYGVATPTESASMGAVGAIFLSFVYGKLSVNRVKSAALDTIKTSSMVFVILIGATAFAMVFSYSGADVLVENFALGIPGGKWTFIIFAMLIILVLGFFIDFIEIAYIVVPILVPIAIALDVNMIWFAILIAMNLQASFLTPPFGFSLFFLRGVAPPSVATSDIYRGVLGFIAIQLTVLIIIILFPKLVS